MLYKLRPHLQSSCPATSLRVLDCGTGCGLFLLSFIEAMDDCPTELSGVDLSPEMLKRARTRLSKQGVRARLCLADICSLPFPASMMDVVTSSLALEYMREPVAALREMIRISRAGAWLVLVTTRPYAPDLPYQVVFRYKHPRKRQVIGWMEEAGACHVRCQPLAGIARCFGQAFVGRKAG